MVNTQDFQILAEKWLAEDVFRHVVTLNPEMVIEAQTNSGFREAIKQADIRTPDGSGIIWAHWYIRSQFWSLLSSLIAFSFRSVERLTGIDIIYILAELAVKKGVGVYLLGGTKSQVEKTATKLKKLYPGIVLHLGVDHGFDMNGPSQVLEDIRAKAPAILLVAYGAPKQTIWIAKHKPNLPSVRMAVGVGGAFAMLSEEKPRAPKWIRRLNMEWVWRLLLEPSRLPRIWRATVEFPALIHKQKQLTP